MALAWFLPPTLGPVAFFSRARNMADLTPESNVENVASRLVHHAIVVDNESPGDGLTMLLARMASLAKDLGCIARGTTSDWDGVVSHLDEAGDEKLSGVYGQQVRLI